MIEREDRIVALTTRRRVKASASREPSAPAVLRPRIAIVAGEMPRIVEECQRELREAGIPIYQRGGMLVRIARLDEDAAVGVFKRRSGDLVLLPVTVEWMLTTLARCATFEKYDGRTESMRAIDPPLAVAKAILAASGAWSFPVLRQLVAAPTLSETGELIARPGYDEKSQIYADFNVDDFPVINEKLSRDDALAALGKLTSLLAEFAFSGGSDSASRSVAISAIVTAAVRAALRTAPLHAANAAKAGSGKTELMQIVPRIVLGRAAPTLPVSGDEEEIRKTLLTILVCGDQIALLDNIEKPLESAALCAAITSETYTDRLLGSSTRATVGTRCMLLATGNHLELVGDLTSRAVVAVLDPEDEQPDQRRFARNLGEYIAAHRGELLAAALTITLAYRAAGMPSVEGPPSRFPDWDQFVRRPLLWLGCADPLSTQLGLRANDPAREGLVALLTAARAAFSDRAFTVADLVKCAAGGDRFGSEMQDPILREAVLNVAGDRGELINARRLGRYLVRNLRRIEDGMRFEEAGADPHTKNRRFHVVVMP